MIALLAISSVLVSCQDTDKSGSNVIEAKNVANSNADIATVKAVIYDEANEEGVTLASCKYENKGFKLKLPKTISNNYLRSIADAEEDDFPEWISVSDKNAKLGYFELCAFDKTGDEIGHFYMERETTNAYQNGQAVYMYSDRNFTMKGKDETIEEDEGVSITCSQEYNCSLKKGYNIIYVTYDMKYNLPNMKVTILCTTQKPSETNWVWGFGSIEWFGFKTPIPAQKFLQDIKKNITLK